MTKIGQNVFLLGSSVTLILFKTWILFIYSHWFQWISLSSKGSDKAFVMLFCNCGKNSVTKHQVIGEMRLFLCTQLHSWISKAADHFTLIACKDSMSFWEWQFAYWEQWKSRLKHTIISTQHQKTVGWHTLTQQCLVFRRERSLSKDTQTPSQIHW